MTSTFWGAVFLLAGSTVGAGIFAIPYVTAQVGYATGLLWLVGLSILTILNNLAYAYVVAKFERKSPAQIVGLANLTLGGFGKYAAFVIVVLGHWGAILAYIIGAGKFAAVLFNQPRWESLFSILIFIFVSIAVWFRIRAVAALDGWLTMGKVFVVILLTIAGYQFISVDNLVATTSVNSLAHFFLPFGVIMGALSGYAVLPEMFNLIKSNKQKSGVFYNAVLVGSLIPVLIYIVFQFIVVGISGAGTTEEAISGLVPFLSGGIIKLGAIFGLMAMLSAYLTLAFVMKDTFLEDFKLPRFRAWYLSILPPFLIYLAGLTSFVTVLDVTGLWLGITSTLLIFLMYQKARKMA